MTKVLPRPFKIFYIYLEPLVTLAGAYCAFKSPEWYLASQIPGPTVSGLLHTNETNMAIRLYGVLLTLLAMFSLAIFPVIANKSDALSFSIARRFIFVLACNVVPCALLINSWRCIACLCCGDTYWREGIEGCMELE